MTVAALHAVCSVRKSVGHCTQMDRLYITMCLVLNVAGIYFEKSFGILLRSSQFWPVWWSKSRQGLGQLPIGRSTFSRNVVSNSQDRGLRTGSGRAFWGSTARGPNPYNGPRPVKVSLTASSITDSFENDVATWRNLNGARGRSRDPVVSRSAPLRGVRPRAIGSS